MYMCMEMCNVYVMVWGCAIVTGVPACSVRSMWLLRACSIVSCNIECIIEYIVSFIVSFIVSCIVGYLIARVCTID